MSTEPQQDPKLRNPCWGLQGAPALITGGGWGQIPQYFKLSDPQWFCIQNYIHGQLSWDSPATH